MNNTKSCFAAIIGKPNAGKSSLKNALDVEKVAIVSDKPQTTRTRITGVLTKGLTQYVFVDTPGLHKAKNKLSEYMVKTVNESICDVDVAVLVTDMAKEVFSSELKLIESINKSKIPAVLLINKIDTVENKEEILGRIAMFTELCDFAAVIPASVINNDGVDILMTELEKFAFESPHFFPDDALTDQPERVIVAEIIREKVLNLMRDEIPHGIAVSIDLMKERENGIIDINATIICERDSHKGMVIGKGGAMLKKIGSLARVEAESFLDAKINLQCWVKVKNDWRNKEQIIKQFGFN